MGGSKGDRERGARVKDVVVVEGVASMVVEVAVGSVAGHWAEVFERRDRFFPDALLMFVFDSA